MKQWMQFRDGIFEELQNYSSTRYLPGVALVITFLELDTFHGSQKNLISYWNCRFTNFDISYEKHLNIHIYCFECPSRFRLQPQWEGT